MAIRENQRIAHPIRHEEDARRLLEISFDGIWAINSELRTSFVNARMAEMLGYSKLSAPRKLLVTSASVSAPRPHGHIWRLSSNLQTMPSSPRI
jgi:PAS domain-containing protein